MEKHTHSKYFKAFLVLYTGFLLYHAIQLEWTTLSLIGLAVGLILAVIAHLRHGYITTILLIIHMSIEWTGHVEHGAYYSLQEFTFHGVHTILDLVFLREEVRTHFYKWRRIVFGTIFSIIVLASLSIALDMRNRTEVIASEHEESPAPIESLILGGILGCTIFHLRSPQNKKLPA